MFNLAHVILKNPNDKVKVRSPQTQTCLFLLLTFHLASLSNNASTCCLTQGTSSMSATACLCCMHVKRLRAGQPSAAAKMPLHRSLLACKATAVSIAGAVQLRLVYASNGMDDILLKLPLDAMAAGYYGKFKVGQDEHHTWAVLPLRNRASDDAAGHPCAGTLPV